MSAPQSFDAIIIGTGQAGNPLAKSFAAHHQRVAIVERDVVGGSCINRGCTPAKTLIASGKVAHQVRHSRAYGIEVDDFRVNMKKIKARKDALVHQFRHSTQEGLEGNDQITLVRGEAHFVDQYTLEVTLADGGTQRLNAPKIFINTGSSPLHPPVEGLDTITPLDSTSIMELEEVPHHLIVLGGGYIGLEFGQLFRRLGSNVTIIEATDQLLGKEDPDVAECLQQILEEEGIRVALHTQLKRVQPHPEGLEATLNTPNGPERLTGSHLLLAVGYRPNSKALQVENAGLTLDEKGYIPVNERLETAVPGIWALGDIKGGPAFTHVAYDDYRIVRNRLFEHGQRTTQDRILTYTVFTDPQLGRVGMSEKEVKEKGIRYQVATMPAAYAARAQETGQPKGLFKILVDADSKQLLGAAILATEGGEFATMLKVAMIGKLPYIELQEGMFAHPTLAESVNNVFSFLKDPDQD
ncbi:Pyruvate/2-oxoglutarate dehydrogenase complex, dihydrolipoamide dehydrogenase (E3) component [Catalinimonas alkaloidigena]|uniref:Pyruvate/2-oxoglutarate dehydrogenase complex, dihydrolipoamide dehydrogenase (E3) component n=1 Tax=Catalinimonas alkaloidigena TaxID=1075417 RepID=A0A1G8X3U8_9BACT|nr:mercuric reductase [Catalinimonas alkaloidigena]SDJ85131.1 Pyruvate/2-oxoglutarate dehydrogenase complex, dihydrolipoamide dehydrogenase (E3) component [Catalinimonas alkaloidigena]